MLKTLVFNFLLVEKNALWDPSKKIEQRKEGKGHEL